MRTYYATFMCQDNDGQLIQFGQVMYSTALNDAKLSARNLAQQNDWRLLDVVSGRP